MSLRRRNVRKPVLDVYVDIITEEEALHGILVAPGEHVAFVGAGFSKEAGIPLAEEICDDIRNQLSRVFGEDNDDWVRTRLNWDDSSRKYASCLEVYGPPEDRVNYFRALLKGHHPSFAHHALALLMSNDKLNRNALTTNFDKLIEQSFVAQNIRECQAIRMPEEAQFWGPEPDKCYLFKLHGDYDTHNILNTRDETRSIPSFFLDLSRELLRSRGLLALGSAGNEESIYKFLEALLSAPEKRFLSRGIRWGVYVGSRKPDHLSDAESANIVVKALEAGGLNRRLVEILSYLGREDRPCHLFPIWGSGRFLMRLIERLGDRSLEYNAGLYMDHDMRITSLFLSNGISPVAVEKHLERLRRARSQLAAHKIAPALPVRRVKTFELKSSGAKVDIVYGDITDQALLANFSATDGRSAIVSADDTMISAGGGVALSILSAAGPQFLLNELGKLAPISHGTVTVTSGGSLPLQYIFHAAALQIDEYGDYLVTADSVRSVVHDCLNKADTLGVNAIFLPLIGAGLAGLSATESLGAILQAADEYQHLGDKKNLIIVVLDDLVLTKNAMEGIASEWRAPEDTLGA
jgi:O-acetyl-ADP-ribose deacetylase (regulator of RNase III)